MAGLRLIVAASLLVGALCLSNLEQYNIDKDTITVSGLSAGGAFATQFHVIYSTEIMGAAIFAGIVYYCALGTLSEALLCMSSPSFESMALIYSDTNSFARSGDIDPTDGMSGDKVYIFAGTRDTVVKPANGDNIEDFYTTYGADILTEFDIAAEHCQPTNFYGPACTHKGGEYINDCEYDGAYIALNHLYGNLVEPTEHTGEFPGFFDTFDQDEFFDNNAKASSMDSAGYVYVPSQCVSKNVTCKLHVVFHGCEQGSEFLGDTYVTKGGYIEVAELNNIILIFPQVIKELVNNPNGCFDWWGYTGMLKYAKKDGVQNIGIKAMVDRLVYGY